MKFPLNINSKEIFVNCSPDDLLVNVLRQQGFYSVKDTDSTGLSGSSTVLLDDKPIPSCLIPAAAARDSLIVTLEFFYTFPEYKFIKNEMDSENIKLCGLCNPGKIFTAYDIILNNYRPSKQYIISRLKDFTCCCVDMDVLVNMIIKSAFNYRNSLGKTDAKK